jgi:hypothetical protein
MGEPLDGLTGANGLGGIDADQANREGLPVEADLHGVADDDALDSRGVGALAQAGDAQQEQDRCQVPSVTISSRTWGSCPAIPNIVRPVIDNWARPLRSDGRTLPSQPLPEASFERTR